jgi:ParB-like chromosome segregation protein Spo0J
MAKRKRLTPPNPDYMPGGAPETKALFPLGVAVHRSPVPVAEVARDSAAAAALEEMTRSWEAARTGGRLVVALRHDEIRLDHLQRDRVALDPEEMAALGRSLAAHGQQTPIEVVALPDGGYGLLSGWRRCQALRGLHAETGEDRFATVQALLRRPEDAGAAYRTMVEENEIRASLSHYERARIVVKSVEAGVFADAEVALKALFGSVPRARRSKIRTFLGVVAALEGAVRFPEAISERAGLDLAARLRHEPALAARLRTALMRDMPEDAAAEQAVIARVLSAARQEVPVGRDPSPARHDADAEGAGAPEVLAEWPGLILRRGRGGALILSGEAVTADLEAALVDWLQGCMTA